MQQSLLIRVALAVSMSVALASPVIAQNETGAVDHAFRAWRKLAGYVPPIAIADWPLAIDRDAQLFVDDYVVKCTSNLTWSLHQPTKHRGNPIAPAGRVSVMLDADGKWRMYRSRMDGATHLHSSRDGINWSKEEHTIGGSFCSVFYDPKTSNNSQRWKASEYRGGLTTSGIYLHYSADGIRWNADSERLIAGAGRAPKDPRDGSPYFAIDDASHVYFDRKLDRYVASFKTWNFNVGDRGDPEYRHTRIRGMAYSDDILHWDRPFLSLDFDEHDPDGFQFYDSVHFPYESMWLGFVRTLDARTGIMNLQLVSSRDGRVWERAAGRQVFLATGPKGSFDGGNLDHAFSAPVSVGDKLYLYYTGSQLGHLGYGGWQGIPEYKTGVGVAVLRRDGFVSLDAGDHEGHIITRPIRSEGRVLHVNVDAGQGELRAEVLDAEGNAIPSYSQDQCVPAIGDTVDQVVIWKTHKDLSGLVGEPFRLKFYLRNASLYSFTMNDGNVR